MLSPDQIQDAGDAIAALYSDMEARMLDHLVGQLAGVDRLGQRSITELNLLAQSMAPELRRIVEEGREAISDEVYETCERLLSASDRDDARRLGTDLATSPAQLAATAAGMQAVLDRDNLKMVEGAKQAFLKFSVEAVAMTNSGLYTAEQAIHRAVRNLTSEGIGVTEVTYRSPQTGAVTVTNRVDVAVRRHVRTQIAQDSGRMTLERMSRLEVALVEVSSHEGSRPTHQAWEGRVYSLKGEVTIDGVRYRDFHSATGYGHVDGLLGANCRHSFGPYRHGAPRAYEPDPKHPSGLSNDEIYKLSQKQRYMERQIRAAKRNVMGAKRLYEKEPTQYARAELAKAQERLKGRQAAMRTLIRDANAKCRPGTSVLHRNSRREWAGDMPKSATTNVMKHEEPLVRMPKERNVLSVSPTVNTKEYHDAFEAMPLPKAVSESIYKQAGRILGKANGTQKEYLCAVDARTGKVLADNLEMAANDGRTGFTAEQGGKIRSCPNGAVVIHNHPSGTRPSITDVITAASESSIKGSVIVGHDGSVWFVSVDNPSIADLARGLYNRAKQELGSRGAVVALDRLLKENGKHELFTWRRVR